MNKPDCYKCVFRGDIAGDAHSCCRHPKCVDVLNNPLGLFAGMIKGTGIIKGLKVKANQHGIDNGWFWFPWNFDPTWLEECSGFKKIKQK